MRTAKTYPRSSAISAPIRNVAHAGQLVDKIRGSRRVGPTSGGPNPDWDSSFGRLQSAPPEIKTTQSKSTRKTTCARNVSCTLFDEVHELRYHGLFVKGCFTRDNRSGSLPQASSYLVRGRCCPRAS